jgi:ABC-type phosphate/phosphonate transport system substrate-binding protein
MSLAPAWLETLLASSKLEGPDHLLGRFARSTKIAQTVLPVYFGSADACVVTRRAFDTMSELNPQLRRSLRVLATSPKLQAAVVGCHKDSSDEIKSRLRAAVTGLYNSPSGRQILVLFQSGPMMAMDTSKLRSSVELVAAYEKLKARRAGATK